MLGLDEWIIKAGGSSGVMALGVALLLGLRHATDPDHLTAVSTLLLSDRESGTRRAAGLGLSWGLGHATTLFLFGLPVILLRRYLPDSIQRVAEAAVGLIITGLAIRLLVRHAHPRVHEHCGGAAMHPVHHAHTHAEGLGRSSLAAFGIGLVHGIGGSAGVGILLIGAVSGRAEGVFALVIFAAATAVSMALVSTAFGHALARGAVKRSITELVPLLGMASLLFGVWYSFGALGGI